MLDHFRRRLLVMLQHLLDEVDAAARAIEFVTEQHIGRARCGAEAAMHALAQDGVGFRDIRIGKLGERKFGLHGLSSRRMRPRLRIWRGSKLCLRRRLNAATPGACGWNTSIAERMSFGARSSMAWPPAASARARTLPAWASAAGGSAAQINRPPQS